MSISSTVAASASASSNLLTPAFGINASSEPGSLSAANYYQVYIQNTFDLASSIIIKSNDAVNALNNYVNNYAAVNGTASVDLANPASWKYYMNLAGLYHYTDTVMEVVSLDTLNTIPFTVQNLALNTATAAGYAYGTYNYKQLVSQYPDQEMLILGILYPVNMAKAIAAAEGTILGYPSSLVETNEYNLISNLQTWINGFKARWVNQQYGISDNLYPATALGLMYLNLVPAILNLRLRACKTNQAHSFHVRMYLASHGFLDQFIDVMTTEQTLFFYRNIAYIERNSGKQATFDWIVKHIMTDRGLPLANFLMRHDLTNQPANLLPNLTFVKSSINGLVGPDDMTNFTLDQILTLEDPLTTGNVEWHANEESLIAQVMENSKNNKLFTKVLQSTAVDYTNSSPVTLTDVLMNHWLWLAANQNYVAVVSVPNPVTGEIFALTVLDAYILAWYCMLQTIAIPLVHIPQFYAKRVQRFVPFVDSPADLMSIVDPAYVDASTANLALSLQPSITSIISTSAFYSTCTEIYNASQLQRNLTSYQENYISRGMVAAMCNRIYSDNVVSVQATGSTYASWLTARNLDLTSFTSDNFTTLYGDLVGQATGLANHTSITLAQIQAAMVSMLQQLSSYGIQIIAQTNTSNIQDTDWTVVRAGDLIGTMNNSFYLPDMVTYPLSDKNSISENIKFDVNLCSIEPLMEDSIATTMSYPIGAAEIEPNTLVTDETYYLFASTVAPTVLGLKPNNLGLVSVPGLDVYLGLSPTDQQSVYQNAPNQ